MSALVYEGDMATSFPLHTAEVEEIYPLSRFNGLRNGVVVQSTGDCDVVCPNYDLAELITRAGATAYLYYFDYGPVCQDEAVVVSAHTRNCAAASTVGTHTHTASASKTLCVGILTYVTG